MCFNDSDEQICERGLVRRPEVCELLDVRVVPAVEPVDEQRLVLGRASGALQARQHGRIAVHGALQEVNDHEHVAVAAQSAAVGVVDLAHLRPMLDHLNKKNKKQQHTEAHRHTQQRRGARTVSWLNNHPNAAAIRACASR